MAAMATLSVPASASPLAPTGTIGIRLLDQPASAAGNPRAQIYIVDHLAPGTEIQRRIEISTTTAAAQVRLYGAAATITDGSFLGAPGDTPNDLSTWTSVTPGAITMTPGQVATATVTITVPTDAAPGEHYGIVWAEARAPASTAGGVTQVNRVGIRLYLSIGPGGPPAADFSIDSLAAGRSADGGRTVVALVHNTGGRALDISGTLDLHTTAGDLHAGPYPADLGTTLAIGATEPVTITVNTDLPAGPWDAQITLHSGLVERSALAELTFPAAGISPAVPTRQVEPDAANPDLQTLMLLALLLFCAVLVALVLSKRTLARRRQAISAGTARKAP